MRRGFVVCEDKCMTHTGHDHPATPAARAKCRKSMAVAPVIDTQLPSTIDGLLPLDGAYGYCMTCEQPSDGDRDGYSSCCNDRVTDADEIMKWRAVNARRAASDWTV